VEAGNVYLNRGITGAVVRRQPFGGWKRSSVGPTAKAGGPNYANCLRHWPRLVDVDAAMDELTTWWRTFGSKARDESGLLVEVNEHRYRHNLATIVVRVDESFGSEALRYVAAIATLTGATISFSSRSGIKGVNNVTEENVDQLVERSGTIGKVRWLSEEVAPVGALLERGVTTDRRPLTQAGDVEGPRWLSEQSVAMTRHRYGNVNAGPKPICRGLGEHE
jgi:RHH-type proline utilization regulon transcriptional repressor/proline dehydrogenase/delta 1-pyrroline-5-carboxylate dehydrogenase